MLQPRIIQQDTEAVAGVEGVDLAGRVLAAGLLAVELSVDAGDDVHEVVDTALVIDTAGAVRLKWNCQHRDTMIKLKLDEVAPFVRYISDNF